MNEPDPNPATEADRIAAVREHIRTVLRMIQLQTQPKLTSVQLAFAA